RPRPQRPRPAGPPPGRPRGGPGRAPAARAGGAGRSRFARPPRVDRLPRWRGSTRYWPCDLPAFRRTPRIGCRAGCRGFRLRKTVMPARSAASVRAEWSRMLLLPFCLWLQHGRLLFDVQFDREVKPQEAALPAFVVADVIEGVGAEPDLVPRLPW